MELFLDLILKDDKIRPSCMIRRGEFSDFSPSLKEIIDLISYLLQSNQNVKVSTIQRFLELLRADRNVLPIPHSISLLTNVRFIEYYPKNHPLLPPRDQVMGKTIFDLPPLSGEQNNKKMRPANLNMDNILSLDMDLQIKGLTTRAFDLPDNGYILYFDKITFNDDSKVEIVKYTKSVVKDSDVLKLILEDGRILVNWGVLDVFMMIKDGDIVKYNSPMIVINQIIPEIESPEFWRETILSYTAYWRNTYDNCDRRSMSSLGLKTIEHEICLALGDAVESILIRREQVGNEEEGGFDLKQKQQQQE